MPTDATRDRELELLAAGSRVVIGMDEVGRGAIAGPVCVGVCAVTMSTTDAPPGMRDSKLLSSTRREHLAPLVSEWAVTATGFASAQEIDLHGISACLGLAGRRALIELHERGVAVAEALVLLDGTHDWLTPALNTPLPVVTQAKADRDCTVVAGASIVAKVARDSVMLDLDREMSGYGWSGNKGYGSAGHFAAIRELGVTDHHRTTWIREAASGDSGADESTLGESGADAAGLGLSNDG